jgi:isocitrate/isopropylmalate dehydrogenase
MAKAKTKNETENTEQEEEQLDLIDVAPANSKAMVQTAKRYKKAQSERIASLEVETSEKQKLLTLIKEANLQRTDDGRIRFRIERLIITVTPRDELIKIKDEDENEG